MKNHPTNTPRERPAAVRGKMFAATAVAGAVVFFYGCTKQPETRGNVILISIDTLRADHLSCYGYERPTSPFMDSLAARGVQFEHAISQVPGTLPSHMTMLTGLLPAEHDVFPPDGVLSEKIPLVAELAAEAGIRTAGFTEGGYVSGRYGFSRGFERFSDAHRGLNTDFEDGLFRGLEFLKSVRPGQQYFLFLHTYSVHDPYTPPLPYAAKYLDRQMPSETELSEPISPGYDLEDLTAARDEARMTRQRLANDFVAGVLPPGAPKPTGPTLSGFNRGDVAVPVEAIPVYQALYDGTINYVDDLLRAFENRLVDLGLDESTTIIITSDHGEEFLEHGRLAHEQVYDECLHVPLIFYGSEVAPGAKIQNLVMTVDLAPTILELLGVAPPRKMTGRSLVPLITTGDGHEVDHRDAYARAFVDPVETIFRLFEGRRFQLVAESPQLLEKDPWVERAVELHPVSSKVTFKARSFHEPRSITVQVDGRPWGRMEIEPTWSSHELVLPDDGGRHVVTMTADNCVSPASIGENRDTRCLAFRLRGFESLQTELFDLSSDPHATNDISNETPERTQALLEALEFFHRGVTAPSTKAPLDAETEQRLRALGYLE